MLDNYNALLESLSSKPMNDLALKDYALSDKTLRKLNNLNDTMLENLCDWVSASYHLGMNFEIFISDWFNHVEKPILESAKGELKVLKSVEERASRGALLSKKDLSYMMGVSLAQIDIYLNRDYNPLPCIQLGVGKAVKFKWSEIEKWINAENVR